MLTPSGGARSNCYKFISWVTGCSHSTIGRVNEQMKETGKCFFSVITRVYLNIVLGNIYLKVFWLGWNFHLVMLIKRRVSWTPSKLKAVEPRYNDPLYNEVLGVTNDFLYPRNSKYMKKKERKKKKRVIANNFCQSLGPSLHRRSTVGM